MFLKFHWGLHAYSTLEIQQRKKKDRIEKLSRLLEMSMVNKAIKEEELLGKDQLSRKIIILLLKRHAQTF